jgi:hypothetical protein
MPNASRRRRAIRCSTERDQLAYCVTMVGHGCGRLRPWAGDRLARSVVVTHPHVDHIGQFDKLMRSRSPGCGSRGRPQPLRPSIGRWMRWSGRTRTTTNRGRGMRPRSGRSRSTSSTRPLGCRCPICTARGSGCGSATGRCGCRSPAMPSATETRIVAQAGSTLAADILQVGHHGSQTFTSRGFLDAVDPTVAVYSASAGNQYGHPHQQVLDRLEGAGDLASLAGSAETDSASSLLPSTIGSPVRRWTREAGNQP